MSLIAFVASGTVILLWRIIVSSAPRATEMAVMLAGALIELSSIETRLDV
ncbi:MAG: hypothetical protein ABI210_00290 [Abditibacteriaceae bacterium]